MATIRIYTTAFEKDGVYTQASTSEFHPEYHGAKSSVLVDLPAGFDFCKIPVDGCYGAVCEYYDEMQIVDRNGVVYGEISVINGEIFLTDIDGVKYLLKIVEEGQ